MFMVGSVSDKARDLCRVTKLALDEAIKICGPGVPIREVGKVACHCIYIFKQYTHTMQASYVSLNHL